MNEPVERRKPEKFSAHFWRNKPSGGGAPPSARRREVEWKDRRRGATGGERKLAVAVVDSADRTADKKGWRTRVSCCCCLCCCCLATENKVREREGVVTPRVAARKWGFKTGLTADAGTAPLATTPLNVPAMPLPAAILNMVNRGCRVDTKVCDVKIQTLTFTEGLPLHLIGCGKGYDEIVTL